MLEKAGLEAIKIHVKMEELKEFLNTVIDFAGNDLKELATRSSNEFMASRASEYGEVIDKCYEIKSLISACEDFKDQPTKELYRHIFRNDPVALNIEKMI